MNNPQLMIGRKYEVLYGSKVGSVVEIIDVDGDCFGINVSTEEGEGFIEIDYLNTLVEQNQFRYIPGTGMPILKIVK